MQVEGRVSKWGNSLALRINSTVADALHLESGSKVVIDVTGTSFSVKPVVAQKKGVRLPLSESALLAGITPELAHADELAQPMDSETGEA